MKLWKAILAAGLLMGGTACTDNGSNLGGGSGSTKVLLTDAPFPYDDVSKVEVYFVKIEASTSTDTIPGGANTAGWVTIAEPNRTFDLLQLQAGNTVLAGSADIPAGAYKAVRVTINTSMSHITMKNGQPGAVQWPVSGELQLNALVEYPVDVAAGGSNIVIDFDVGKTFLSGFSGGFVFSPWIRAVNDAVTGTIQGVVTQNGTPVANASVTAYRGDPAHTYTWWDVTGARTDANGHYVLTYLPDQAPYHVYASAPVGQESATQTNVSVTRGQATTLNLGLANNPPPPPDTTVNHPDTTGSGGNQGGAVAGVNINPASQTRAVGDSIAIFAALVNAQGQALYNRTVTFSSSDSSVVDFRGVYGQSALLNAKKAGSVTIVATSEGKSGSATVTVH